MPDPQTIWGPVSWLIDPPDAETLARIRAEHAHDLGFEDAAALDQAQDMANWASDGDPAASVALHYIHRDITRVAGARNASKAPRRGKWHHVKPEAMQIAAQIMTRRPDLNPSSVAVLVLDTLAKHHDELPDRTTISKWIVSFVN